MAPPASKKEGPAVPPSQQKQLHLITMSTPNGQRAQIALEELKAAYSTDFSYEVLSIMANYQKEDWFLKLNGNGRVPLCIENKPGKEPFYVMESAAIELFLAKEYDLEDRFGFKDDYERNECIQWILFAVGSVGPMQGQFNHFNKFSKEKLPYAIGRFHDEVLRLYSVLDDRLSGKFRGGAKREYLAGKGIGKYSWADISAFTWINKYEFSGITKDEMKAYSSLLAWLDRINERPAVKEALGPKYQLQ